VCLPGRGCKVAAGDAASFAVLSDWGEERGPHKTERSSRWLLSRDVGLHCCFAGGEWRPSPQLERPDPSRAARFQMLVDAEDAELLRRFSSTPEDEGPRFLLALRDTLRLAISLAQT